MTVQPRAPVLPMETAIRAGPDRAALAAQQRAWVGILVAFGVWCALVVWLGLAANTWRKTAYSAPPAQLLSKRGIVLYQGPRDSLPVSIAEQTNLEEGGVLDVPANSEATIRLGVDGSTIRLRSSTQLKLTAMRIGRFNRDLTQVRLEQLKGAADFGIAGGLPDDREVEVRTPQTVAAQEGLKLTKGDYLVWVQTDTTRLLSYGGQAKVLLSYEGKDEGQTQDTVHRLRDGNWLAFGTGRGQKARPSDLPEQLLKNRDFSRGLGDAWSPIDIGEKGRPDVGGQRSVVEETINGLSFRSLRLLRDTAKDTHNETGLTQLVDREVWAYRGLTFSALVKVTSSSLDGGGYAGSEYPLMFRIHYVAENGGSYTWAHGFYAHNVSNRPAEIGEELREGEWYEYKLDMTQLKDRPAFISTVEVLASGHDFDAQAANIKLTAE